MRRALEFRTPERVLKFTASQSGIIWNSPATPEAGSGF
jgi:hypothetical protein